MHDIDGTWNTGPETERSARLKMGPYCQDLHVKQLNHTASQPADEACVLGTQSSFSRRTVVLNSFFCRCFCLCHFLLIIWVTLAGRKWIFFSTKLLDNVFIPCQWPLLLTIMPEMIKINHWSWLYSISNSLFWPQTQFVSPTRIPWFRYFIFPTCSFSHHRWSSQRGPLICSPCASSLVSVLDNISVSCH